MLVSCFALWGLLNNMTDNLVPAFSKIFMINAAESAAVQISFYGAYAVLAIFASILIEEFSYKVGVLIGLGFYMIGALCYIPAAIGQSFDIYLVAIFVLAGGLSILETTCNPFVLSMGPDSTSVRRLNLAQAFNPIGSLTGIFLAKYFILANLHPADMDTRKAMDPTELDTIVSNELFWVCVPYVGLVAIAAVIWFFFCRYKSDDTSVPTEENTLSLSKKLVRLALCIAFILVPFLFQLYSNIEFGMVQQILIMMIGPIAFLIIMPDYRVQLMKLIRLPRYLCGVVAQFFYVGVQIAVWTWTIKYVMAIFPGMQEAAAATYYLYSIVLFIACRAITTALMKKFNPANMMSLFAVLGIGCCLGTMYLPASVSIWMLVGISGCMSLMFPTIYGIALRGLGSEVKLGAAGLIMAILGGAVITPYMGSYIDNTTIRNQAAYFESIERPLIAQIEAADTTRSISGSMLAIYKMTEPVAEAGKPAAMPEKTAKNIKTFASLPSLEGKAFADAAKTLPGCASLKNADLARLKENLSHLPAIQTEEEQTSQFILLPALCSVDGKDRAALDDLIAKPLDMQQFQKAQQNFTETSVRSSFFIPIICFSVVLLYAFFFRNVHLKNDENNAEQAA